MYYIIVYYKYIRFENFKIFLFGGLFMKILKYCYFLDVCEEIKLKWYEKIKIYFEYGKMNVGNKY